MIRAAAKNYQDVAVVVVAGRLRRRSCDEMRASGGALSLATHWRLAKKAFRLTADYDRAISARLARIDVEDGRFEDRPPALPPVLDLRADRALDLRYGENPHQSAALYAERASGHRRRGAAAGQGAFLQQPGGPGRRLAAGLGVRRRPPRPSSSTPTRAAAPSRRLAGRELPQGVRGRPGVGLRRRAGLQPAARRGDRARDRQDLRRGHRRAGLHGRSRWRSSPRRRTCACSRCESGRRAPNSW